jgi:hypothetical protein
LVPGHTAEKIERPGLLSDETELRFLRAFRSRVEVATGLQTADRDDAPPLTCVGIPKMPTPGECQTEGSDEEQ